MAAPSLFLELTQYIQKQGTIILVSLFLGGYVLFPSGSAVFADTVDQKQLESFLHRVEHEAAGTKTVQCSFIQERNLTIFSKPVLFTGRMLLSRPDKLRWENLDPIPAALIFSGEKGLRCNDDVPPVHFDLQKDPVMKMVAEQIWTWADGDYKRLKDKFSITLIADNIIELSPGEDSAHVIEKIRVTFDPRTLQPQAVLVLENGGDSTKINFFNYLLNEPLDDALFTTCSP